MAGAILPSAEGCRVSHVYNLQQTVQQVHFIPTIVHIILSFKVKVQDFTSQFPLSHFFFSP